MANNALVKQAIIAGLTKYPRLELLGRYAGAFAGGGILGYAACYIVVKGFYVPDRDTVSLILQVIGGVVLSALATRLGWTAQQKSEATVVANTIEAAITNKVPEAIAAKATPAQAAAIEASPTATVADVPPAVPAKAV